MTSLVRESPVIIRCTNDASNAAASSVGFGTLLARAVIFHARTRSQHLVRIKVLLYQLGDARGVACFS